MPKFMVLTCVGLGVAACSAEGPREPSASQVEELNARLAGYEQSGPPVSCVSMRDLRGNKSYGEGVIVFDGPTNSSLYVNHPPAGCPELDVGRALITKTPTDRLCRGDIATVFDTGSRTPYGSCGLGDFTPYRRVRR